MIRITGGNKFLTGGNTSLNGGLTRTENKVASMSLPELKEKEQEYEIPKLEKITPLKGAEIFYSLMYYYV